MTQAFNLALLANKVNSSGQLDPSTGLSSAVPVANGGTGSTTLSANSVLLGNGTGALQSVAPGASGNVLSSNGATWVSAAPGVAGYKGQVFTTVGTSTFTVPSGITAIKVTVIGGGGGGGSTTGGVRSASGGGAGGTAIKYITGLTPGGTVTVTVGGGGGAGASGGTSSFGAYCSATGGSAGVANTGGFSTSNGGAGGSGSSGDLNFTGGVGGGSIYSADCTSAYAGLGGGGGGTMQRGNFQTNGSYVGVYPDGNGAGMFGSGGVCPAGNGNGGSATGYGNGGAGAVSFNVVAAYTGGSGTAGLVIVEW